MTLCLNFGYTPEQVGALTEDQVAFLLQGVKWASEKMQK